MAIETGGDVDMADGLLGHLLDADGQVRARAREEIVKIGPPLTPRLTRMLLSPEEPVRWEAVRALAQIADPSSAPALVGALTDPSYGVRWLAASGLIVLGAAGLPTLLRALMSNSGSVILRHSAHRVIFDLVGREQFVAVLTPVLRALESAEPPVTVPLAAHAALEALEARA